MLVVGDWLCFEVVIVVMYGYYVDFVLEGYEVFQDQFGVFYLGIQCILCGVDVGFVVQVELIFVVVVEVVGFEDVWQVEFSCFCCEFVVVMDVGEGWQWNIQLLEQGFFV